MICFRRAVGPAVTAMGGSGPARQRAVAVERDAIPMPVARVPVVVLESEASVGLPKLALQALVPVLVQVT